MHPILFKIGSLNIYSYGLMVAMGFGISAMMIYARAPKFGFKRDTILDYFIIMLISGVAGARLLYVSLNIRYYLLNPLEIANLSKGGLIWYGGFIAAILASLWFVKARSLEFWAVADFIAPYIALGQAFGRIGCFLNGCCYGIVAPYNFPLGQRHPTQIYSAILLFIIFAALVLWQNKRRFNGEIFLGYCLLYSCKRFAIEFLRGDNPRIFFGMTMSQAISLAVFLIALYVFKARLDLWKLKRLSALK